MQLFGVILRRNAGFKRLSNFNQIFLADFFPECFVHAGFKRLFNFSPAVFAIFSFQIGHFQMKKRTKIIHKIIHKIRAIYEDLL